VYGETIKTFNITEIVLTIKAKLQMQVHYTSCRQLLAVVQEDNVYKKNFNYLYKGWKTNDRNAASTNFYKCYQGKLS
jgi:hypothetical protein